MERRGRIALFLLSGAILLVGGGVGGYLLAPDQTPAVRAGPAPSLPAGWSLCANAVHGYAIGYPAGWHTTHLSADDACRFFDPKPIELIPGTDCCPTALAVYPVEERFERVLRGLSDPMFERVLARAETAVGGRRAVRLETEATGAGLYDEGTKTYAYLIDRDGKAFLVQTTAAPLSSEYRAWKAVVDRAVRTLRLSRPAASGATAGEAS